MTWEDNKMLYWIFQKLLSSTPKMLIFIIIEVLINYLIGIALHNLGKNEDPIIDYSKAIEINPQYANAYVNRGKYFYSSTQGNVLNDLGRTEDSILDYSKAIDINPHFSVAFYNRGQYYYK